MKFQTGKKIALVLLVLLLMGRSHAQKPVIDSAVFGKWWDLRPTQGAISDDGNYIFYAVSKDLFLSSADNRWRKEFGNIMDRTARFTRDGSRIVFQRNDSAFIVGLGKEEISYISGIEGKIDFLSYSTGDDILLYKLKTGAGQLFARAVSTGAEHSFPAIEKYWFNQKKGTILLLVKEQKDAAATYFLKSANIKDNTIVNVWQGGKIDNLVFSNDGTACSFLARDSREEAAIWYTGLATPNPVQLVHENDPALEPGFKLANVSSFDKTGNKLYLKMTRIITAKKELPKGVDVYNYKDPIIQSEQLFYYPLKAYPQPYTAVMDIRDKKIIRVEDSYARSNDSRYLDLYQSKWILVQEADKSQNIFGGGDAALDNEWNWNKKTLTSAYLLSLENGSKKYLIKDVPWYQSGNYYLAPGEDYVVFYDPDKVAYYSYEIATGITRSISGGKGKWTRLDYYDYPVISDRKYGPNGIAGFSDDGRYVLLYDQFDIYKADITGKEKAINLTAGYGLAHHVVFRVDLNQPRPVFKSNEKILLSAFNIDTKERGFYTATLDPSGIPDSLSMQPKRFEHFGFNTDYGKAKNAGAYLVVQGDERSFPNLYFSKDLKKFTAVSDIHPEKNYNWLTAELVSYKLPDGRFTPGVLYKPENFDPNKKYPVIINYYERLSNHLHDFRFPEASGGDIDIPYYVSNGYLVFNPDIQYTVGYPGRSALNAIVSAAQFLAKRPYVNAKKMAVQGTSFGGFQTNYIITHTNMFAAAMSNSGMTDFVSIYGSIIGDNRTTRQRQYEINHDRMGGSLWDMPDKYIENSPVLLADKITTPLLMVANDADGNVPPQQGVELFTALRRLQKKSWMLQYDGSGHGVDGKEAKNDFSIRVFQFFNYYLKDAAPPLWMTEGVPAENKGLFTGLSLDHSGNTP